MAIDTAQKQASFLHYHLPTRGIPLPNGAFDQADMQTMLGRYGGILWSSVTAAQGTTLTFIYKWGLYD